MLIYGPQPSIGWAGVVWLCPTCENMYYGFEVPEWGYIWYDEFKGWRKPEPRIEISIPQKAPHEKWLGK